MLLGVGLSGVFFVVGLPVVAIVGTATAIFLGHHFHTVVSSTACGSDRVHWPNDGFVDMLWKPAYVGWLVACATGPAMIIGGLLAKHVGVAGLVVPALCFWLMFPVVQLSSFFASSVWVPFTPVTLRKMAGRPGATLGFYAQSFGVMLFGCVGLFLTFFPHRLGWAGSIAGAFALAASLFVYARLLGRLAFVCSFVGAEERPPEARLPHYTRDEPVARPRKKKKRPATMPKRERMNTPDPDDGEGYGVNFADELPPAGPEPEKEFVPPHFAWDDDPVTAYEAKAAEVDIKEAVDVRVFAVNESELKLISRDAPKEPDRAWTAEVWTGLFADPNTGSNFGIAVVWLVIDGIVAHVMRGFLG
jgi:hypothetical protein